MTKDTCTIEKIPFDECQTDDTINNGDSNTCFDGMCVEIRDGQLCPVDNFRSPWEITENSSDACIIDSYLNEQLNIGGADINVYKLLGIHEQGKLQDLTGDGIAISGGDHPNFKAKNAFDLFNTEWRSLQLGENIVKNSYIGYDFGEIKLDNNRLRYGIETFIKHNISRIRIKQGCDTINKVKKIRLERSHDGKKWYGVGISDVQDCDGIVTIDFRASVPSRYWRIRPIEFGGGENDYWGIQALQLIEYEKTQINNIQDKLLMENRDRDYAEFPEKLKGSYTPFDTQAFISKLGLANNFNSEQYFIEFNWSDIIRVIGRPLVIGDIIQLPSETQYTVSLTPVLKYLTIIDVAWSPNGYSPQWIPLLVRIIAEPAFASPETQDIFGKLTEDYDETGLADTNDGINNKKYQDIFDIDHTISAQANTEVPERGEDFANVQKFSPELYEWEEKHGDANLKRKDRVGNIWGQDAMPPNGESFTQGDNFPPSPKNGDYHRLTYSNIRQGIPPRLYRFSTEKNTWIYLETDKRAYNSVIEPRLQEFFNPDTSTVTRPDEIDEEFKK
jgi:hypothetical protein